MDLISQLGYSTRSPFKNNPYLDINTPDGLISMSETNQDLIGLTPAGEVQYLKAKRKKPYRFNSNLVREIPIKQFGGFNVYEFLFGDDTEDEVPVPVQEEVEEEEDAFVSAPDKDYELALQLAMEGMNPYQGAPNANFSTTGKANKAPAGFQSFSTYEEGRAALEKQLKLYQTGRTRNPVKPDSTLLQAMSVYAPYGDGNNNPKAYADFIARKLGISITTPIKDINTKAWADAIEKMEGNKTGNNPGNLRFSK